MRMLNFAHCADGTSTPMASTASEAAATVAAVEQPALSPPPPGLDSLRTDMLPSVCQPPLVFVEGKRDGGESAAREVAFPVPIGLTSSPSNVSLAVANKYALMHGETGAEPTGAFGGANVDAGEIRGFGSALAIDMASTSAHHLFVPAGIVDARDSTAKDVLSAAPLPPSSTTVTTSSELLAYSPGRNRRPRSIAEREDAIVEDRPYHQKAPTKGGIAFGVSGYLTVVGICARVHHRLRNSFRRSDSSIIRLRLGHCKQMDSGNSSSTDPRRRRRMTAPVCRAPWRLKTFCACPAFGSTSLRRPSPSSGCSRP